MDRKISKSKWGVTSWDLYLGGEVVFAKLRLLTVQRCGTRRCVHRCWRGMGGKCARVRWILYPWNQGSIHQGQKKGWLTARRGYGGPAIDIGGGICWAERAGGCLLLYVLYVAGGALWETRRRMR